MMLGFMARKTTSITGTVAKGVRHLDLDLPKDKKPTDIADFNSSFPFPLRAKDRISSYAVGSFKVDENIYHKEDLGLFQGVYEAWKNHWNLRTRPEDWWFPVACRIAKAIDKAAKSEAKSSEQSLRELFVAHDGKKNLCVDVDVFEIHEIKFDDFFQEMASQIGTNIKSPDFSRVMQNDFSCSTGTHQIASQINLMASMQEFFTYECGMMGCGIKGLEMIGEQRDWDALVTKLKKLRAILKPVEWSLGLYSDWWDHVEMVYRNLAKSFAASSSNENMAIARNKLDIFWSNILIDGKGIKYYGPSGMQQKEVEQYNGWLIKFLTGRDRILKEDLSSDAETKEMFSGINRVPMKVTYKWKTPQTSEDVSLMAGVMGFQLHDENSTFNEVPSVEVNHMWCLTK